MGKQRMRLGCNRSKIDLALHTRSTFLAPCLDLQVPRLPPGPVPKFFQDRYVYLTNRFHFAVRLYSDNAQMTSKHGKNKEVRYEPQASSVTDVLTMF